MPNGDWISHDRTGLTFNDCTCAAFAMDISWKKVLNTITPCTWVVLNYFPRSAVPSRLTATTQGYFQLVQLLIVSCVASWQVLTMRFVEHVP